MIRSRVRELNKLAFPMIIAQLSYASMGFIDTLLLGQLGVEQLAGGGLGAVVYQFHYIVGIGILVATANHIAFAKGKNDEPEVQRSMLSGAIIVLVMSVLFGCVIWNAGPVLLLFGQDPVAVEKAVAYLQIVVWALPAAFGFILIRSLVLGLGDARGITAISITAAVANYPLSYALMNGLFGLPAMGLRGVALGSLILAFCMFLAFAILTYRKPVFKPFPFWSGWHKFRFSQLIDTLRLGVPIAIAHAMEIGLFSSAALLVGLVGLDALAAHQIALQCATIAFMVPLGVSQAVSVKVGESFGAHDFREVNYALYTGLFVGAIGATIAASVFVLFPESLIQLFLDVEMQAVSESIVPLAVSILIVAALFQFVDGAQVIIMGALRGLKLGTSPTLIAIFSYWIVGFPFSYFLMDEYGAVGVWSGLGIGLAMSCILSTLLFRHKVEVLSSPPPLEN